MSKDTTFERALLALDQTRLATLLDEAIATYREFVELHGYDAERATGQTVVDVLEGIRATVELDDLGEL